MCLIALIGFVSIYIAGCSNQEQSIEVQKRIGIENIYEEFKMITNNQQVQNVWEIINNGDWETAKVQMALPPDYRFAFHFHNEEKAVLFELWISPNKDMVEIIKAGNKYVQLDRNKSAELFEALTGEKLADQE